MFGTLFCVRMNSMMMENFHHKEVEDMKPMDLDKLQDQPDYEEDVEPNINEEVNVEEEQR